jgi:WD40 repeat protein
VGCGDRSGAVLKGPAASVRHIAWSQDGTRLAMASSDKTGREWDVSSLPKGNLFQIACASLLDKNVEELAKDDYHIIIKDKICEQPEVIPLPPNSSDWDADQR